MFLLHQKTSSTKNRTFARIFFSCGAQLVGAFSTMFLLHQNFPPEVRWVHLWYIKNPDENKTYKNTPIVFSYGADLVWAFSLLFLLHRSALSFG
jgi:hypothetical protein